MRIHAITLALMLILSLQNLKGQGSDHTLKLGLADKESVLKDKDYYIWGGSPIKGDDGLYHLFYSRWKKEYGFLAWVTHSEIAHAVSKRKEGPYEFSDLSLPPRGSGFWDGLNTHNPTIHKFGNSYYLYYTGNTGDGKNMKKSLNATHRNNQRIGVAVSQSPYGPWQRFDSPLIDVSADSLAHDAKMIANPSVTQMPDGRFLMVYKAVGKRKGGIWGGPVVHLCAIGDSPTGPFVKHTTPIFTANGSDFPAEDPYIWCQDSVFYAIVKDMHGSFTNRGRSLALFYSNDGINWKPTQNTLVAVPEIAWNDGSKTKLAHLERPQLLIEDGVPTMLFLAADAMDDYSVNDDGLSFNVHVPILNSCADSLSYIGNDFPMSEMVGLVPNENALIDPEWNIWCGSVVEGYDGKYHLFYSRWPKTSGHESWISHSEIAYAVANQPEGPYETVNVALGFIDNKRWDGCMAHNPYVIKHGGKYYLYYIATKGEHLDSAQKLVPYGEEWWTRRNTQRIGVAVADSPAGPWQHFDTPVLSNSSDSTAFDALMVSNPAVCVGRDGKIVMLYKAVSKNSTISGGKVRFSVAFADKPTGPFIKTNIQIFLPQDTNARMVAEDPFIWYDKKVDRYFAIVRDVVRQFTGQDSGGLALMESGDAIDWHPVRHPKVLPPKIYYTDGTFYDANKNSFERPFLLFDKDGKPKILFGACGIDADGVRRAHSFNMRIPLH